MKTKVFRVTQEKEETLYECPECKQHFAAFTIIEEVLWKQIPAFCIYCGAKMDVPEFIKPGEEKN